MSLPVLSSHAADGIWSFPGSGVWSDTSNWSNGAVAGDGGSANLDTVDIVGATTADLDADRSLGAMILGDADPSTDGTWTLSGVGILTLTGTGQITANTNATLGTVIAGTAGLTKLGASTLTLTNTGNTWTGGATLTSGTLVLGNTTNFSTGGIPLSSGTITFQGGTLSHAFPAGNTLIYDATNPWAVGSNTTSTVITPNRFRLNAAVTGDGTLNMQIATTVARADFQNNWAGFGGTLNLSGSGFVRLGVLALGSGQPNFNAAGWLNTTLNISGVTLAPQTNSFGNTIQIGALSGTSGTLNGGSAGTPTYSIGAKNLSTTFGGTIVGNAALTKTGTGTFTLTGASTYSGATTVNGGTLQLGDGGTTGSLPAAGTITVASGASLIVNRSVATAQGTDFGATITGAGSFVQGGTGITTLTGTNTYTGRTSVDAGRLVLASTAFLASTTYSIGTNAVFDVSGQNAYSLSGFDLTVSTNGTASGLLDAGALQLTLGGNLVVNFTTASLGAASLNLLDFGSETGTFDSITLAGSLAGSLTLVSENLWTGTVDGYDFSFNEATGVLTVVPELPPHAYALVAAGVMGLLMARRRRAA